MKKLVTFSLAAFFSMATITFAQQPSPSDVVQETAESVVQPVENVAPCLLYTSPSPRDRTRSRMPSSA